MEKKFAHESLCNRFVKQLVDVIELAATLVLCYLLKPIIEKLINKVMFLKQQERQLLSWNGRYLYMFTEPILFND